MKTPKSVPTKREQELLNEARARIIGTESGLPKTAELATLLELTGEDSRMIQRIAGEFREAGSYNLSATIRALLAHYKEKASKVSESKAADSAARERAERIKAEIETAGLLEKTMLREHVEMIFRDVITKVRVAVEKSKMSPKDKAEFAEMLAGMKLLDDK